MEVLPSNCLRSVRHYERRGEWTKPKGVRMEGGRWGWVGRGTWW